MKTEEGFKNIYQMSAYHHVKDQTAYPAVLLTTGINDPRVDPWMPGKMTARLQAATSSGKPVLLRVDYGGGHGGGSGETEQQETAADKWSFLLWQFGVPGFQPNPRGLHSTAHHELKPASETQKPPALRNSELEAKN